MPDRDKEKYNEYMRKYMLNRYKERMAWARERLGNECSKCGETENLEIDHINPNEKKFGIGGSHWNCSWDKFKEEVDKCQLLCSSCHKKKSSEDGSYNHPNRARGERSNLSKLTKEDIIKIRELYKTEKFTQQQIAKMFPVTRKAIGDIVNRVTWKHI